MEWMERYLQVCRHCNFSFPDGTPHLNIAQAICMHNTNEVDCSKCTRGSIRFLRFLYNQNLLTSAFALACKIHGTYPILSPLRVAFLFLIRPTTC